MWSFLCATTLGKGTLPILSEDVRRLIFYKVNYPRVLLRCGLCGIELLQCDEHGTYWFVNTHPTMWIDRPYCVSCFLKKEPFKG